MFTINNYNYECTKQCKNKIHGRIINAAISKRPSISLVCDEKLAAFIAKSCRNFANITDDEGYTPLHIAAATDRYAVVEWLINHGSNVNAKLRDAGLTPLHFAIQNGCLDSAALLLSYGAKIDIPNSAGILDPLKNFAASNNVFKTVDRTNELLVWGCNKNYNLGIGNEEGKPYPQYLDYFRKQKIFVRYVSLSAYHCLYATETGSLYAVGHGNGGRLGIGNEKTIVEPELVTIQTSKKQTEFITDISVARNHSLALTKSGLVYSCGSNAYAQLGFKPAPDKLLTFKEVQFPTKNYSPSNLFLSVIARDYHSLAYTATEIYVWGTNAGQFGMKTEIATVFEPTLLQTISYEDVSLVDSSQTAIVLYSSNQRKLLLYNKYKIRKISTPKHRLIAGLSLTGGENDDVLRIVMCMTFGEVYIWYDDLNQSVKCNVSVSPLHSVDSILWCGRQDVLLQSAHGLYRGKIALKNVRTKTEDDYQIIDVNKSICNDREVHIDTQRIAHIDRVVSVACDPEGESFVAFQENCRRFLNVPPLQVEEMSFKNLMTEATESDSICDVVFHVEGETFSAHKYIVFSRAKGLQNVVLPYGDKHIYLNYKGLSSKMFELMMKHIYCNHSLSLTDVEDIETSLGAFSGWNNMEVFTVFREFAGKFGLGRFASFQFNSSEKKEPFRRLNRHAFPDLYDVTIKCSNNMEIKAHKCVLVARLEYFSLMFGHSWAEKNVINFTTVPIAYMEIIVNFLYTNDAVEIHSQTYSDNFIYNMISICDQYFITRLRNIFEYILIDKLSIKRCGEMLELACMYNCEILERVALDFIVQNSARILEARALDAVDVIVLKKINEHYRKTYNCELMMERYDAPSDDVIESFVDDFVVDLNYKYTKKTKSVTEKSPKTPQAKRQYEKEAIELFRHSFAVDEQQMSEKNRKSDVSTNRLEEAEKLAQELLSKSKAWTKVSVDKKSLDHSKKSVVVGSLKANDILKTENKLTEKFVNLKILKNEPELAASPKKVDVNELDAFSSRPTISLASFTPQINRRRISQKQRKLSQNSSAEEQQQQPEPSNPIAIPMSPKKVWANDSAESHSFADIMKSPESLDSVFPQFNVSSNSMPKVTAASPVSPLFAKKMPKTKSAEAGTSLRSSFSKIQKDEKKERAYYEKLKTKSFVLTQIEETAIDELKKFYNVDNVFDERIQIERKIHVKSSMNFAVWHQQQQQQKERELKQ